ncbi:MAG: 50S ribosomal protein L24e [Aigarchaeota archaeon]|nr:50S ribosomal protein L24e [Aigarchaeota archaeon]MDW8092115.1 50S ribosomal protein L24e [Nitrososphaerota archaeon]
MLTKHRCTFCGGEFIHGIGLLYVKRDGTVMWFCSRRCRVYMIDRKRDPRRVRWTTYYGKEKGD